eukprot:1980695-Ditylum_brightwellii.AAC.1
MPPPIQTSPSFNDFPRREERRDLLSTISHLLGCNDNNSNCSAQSANELLKSDDEEEKWNDFNFSAMEEFI